MQEFSCFTKLFYMVEIEFRIPWKPRNFPHSFLPITIQVPMFVASAHESMQNEAIDPERPM